MTTFLSGTQSPSEGGIRILSRGWCLPCCQKSPQTNTAIDSTTIGTNSAAPPMHPYYKDGSAFQHLHQPWQNAVQQSHLHTTLPHFESPSAPVIPTSVPQGPPRVVPQQPTVITPPSHRSSSVNAFRKLKIQEEPPLQEYYLVTLERTNLKQPWGLTLELYDGEVEVCRSNSSTPTTFAAGVHQRSACRTNAPQQSRWWWRETSLEKKVILNQFLASRTWERTSFGLFEQRHVLVAINDIILGPCRQLSPVMDVFKQSCYITLLLLRPVPRSFDSPPSIVRLVSQQPLPSHLTKSVRKKEPSTVFRNPLFTDPKNPSLGLPFSDNSEDEFDEGRRAKLFIAPVTHLENWIQERKQNWRKTYKVYRHCVVVKVRKERNEEEVPKLEQHVPKTFWVDQGFEDISDWLQHRKTQWCQSYSWRQRKRQRIERDVNNTQNVSFSDNFESWLRVRKLQWRLRRRQRVRARDYLSKEVRSEPVVSARSVPNVDMEMLVLDKLLDEKEEKERQRKERCPMNITWLFDTSLGCPDDAVAHCLRYLPPKEHGKLLALNRFTRTKLAERETLWRLLCPSHWSLPRRPRQPYHVLYWTKLRKEDQICRKIGDDLLSRSLDLMAKGDFLVKFESLVAKAEKRNGNFSIDYSSGVVCERNSLLNLAVIHGRQKIARWLVEVKGADIESEDRGRFTPLLNAAWSGDRTLVRLFLSRGSNRKHIGYSHYTRPLALPDFEGRTAAGWAEFRGHKEVAELIRLGL